EHGRVGIARIEAGSTSGTNVGDAVDFPSDVRFLSRFAWGAGCLYGPRLAFTPIRFLLGVPPRRDLTTNELVGLRGLLADLAVARTPGGEELLAAGTLEGELAVWGESSTAPIWRIERPAE